jgi:superoxide dismutase, Cu-Zn family
MQVILKTIFAVSIAALAGCASVNKNHAAKPTETAADDRAVNNNTPSGELRAVAQMRPTIGNQVHGSLTFIESAAGRTAGRINVQVRLNDVPGAGNRGLHVHEKGDCSAPDAESAGGHFNAASTAHGGRDSSPRHPGDLGNVAVRDGRVTEEFEIEGVTLDRGALGIAGRSVILHAGADDLKTQPSGNSGARIACGVIELSQQ